MDSLQQYDVAIAGGGMVGMTMAVALAREGIHVALIEKSPLALQLEPQFDGRVSAIALGSQRLLDHIKVWEAMAPYAEPINDIRVSDGDMPFFLHYDHEEIANETGGAPFGYIVENRHIRHALHGAAAALPNLTIMDNTRIEKFTHEKEGMNITLSCHFLGSGNLSAKKTDPRVKSEDDKSKTIACRLLIGADGKQSQVRNQAGIGAVEWGYKQTAIVCTIEHEKPHHGLAQERFLPAGPFAVLPMKNNQSSLVWVEPEDRVALYLELPDDEFAQEITERVGDYLGKISPTGKRFCYPLSLMHAKSYIDKRIALVGDAAHGIHPIAGQGVNLGFRDVAVLMALLGQRFRSGLDLGGADILEHYQRWRRFDNVTMLAVTDGLNRLFSNNVIPIRLARGLGLWAVGRMPRLKRFFMRDAMGLTAIKLNIK